MSKTDKKKSPRKTSTGKLDAEALSLAAECLKTLAHPHRLQIVQLLMDSETTTLTVNDIAEACDLNQPTTSDHLRLMQRCGFLTSHRDGRTVFYEIDEPHLYEIMNCIKSRFG